MEDLSSSFIQVSDFDSLHQASLWRMLGATQATVQLRGALRTSILLGNVLTLDRNQLLDGIFFLTQGPEGIAAALGLAPHDPLPIVVMCQPGTSETTDIDLVPAMRGNLRNESISTTLQLDKVRDPSFTKASSVYMALLDTSHSWLVDPINHDNWERGAGISHFSLAQASEAEIITEINKAQDAWIKAINDGRVAVKLWSATPPDVRAVLAQKKAQGLLNEERPLARYLLDLNETRRSVVTQNIADKFLGEVAASNFDSPNNALNNKLNNEVTPRVDQFDTFKVDENEARIAMESWSRAYYEAIAQRDGIMFLSFFDNLEETQLSKDYGLYYPKRSRTSSLLDSFFLPEPATTVRVHGEILDQMQIIAPTKFTELYLHTRGIAQSIRTGNSPQAMYDLALAVQETTYSTPSYTQKRKATVLRVLTATLVTTIVTVLGLLSDLVDLNRTSIALMVISAAFIGFVFGLPWSEIMEWRNLRKSKMTATLAIAERR